MENTLQHMEEILSQNISGFHQYNLEDPAHLCYVSQSLCKMTGFTQEELLKDGEDFYASIVCPAHRAAYRGFLGRLKTEEQTLACEYTLLKKDGSALSVCDTITSRRMADGTMAGYSVLTDMAHISHGASDGASDKASDGASHEAANGAFFDEAMPCGFMKFTCEKQPRITYINERMRSLLRFPKAGKGEPDDLELCMHNIFLMIPMEERRVFSLYLNRAYAAGTPVTGEMTLLRRDGTRAYVFGWVTKCVNEQGAEEFQSVCIDVTERHQEQRAVQVRRYLKALTEAYDVIFEYDFSNHTVNCLYSSSPMPGWLEHIPMQMDDATEKWIVDSAVEEDQDKIRSFFDDFCQNKIYQAEDNPHYITYKVRITGHEPRLQQGIFLKMDQSVSLYCCRCISDARDMAHQGAADLDSPAVQIRTFGYFDVFVDEKPIAFRNKKSKELFALLVDRRGGYVTSEEAISFLWEDEPVSPVILARYRKVALRLKNILMEYGIADVVESVDGKRRIVTGNVRCDLYDYLSGGEEFAKLFKGSYLTNYSWGENTLAELTGDMLAGSE